MTTSTSSFGSTSFLNLFGILVSIVLCILFIILGGHTLKYIKAFAVKIKIIVNRADDKNVQLHDFNYSSKSLDKKQKTPAFEKIEQVFKNEIKKSRSLQFCNIFKNYIAKYDHIVYYPFRDKISEQYDLLKPKTTFYTLLVICTACVAWMTTIFLTAILQNSYSNVTLIPMGTFIGLTVAISVISACLNLIATNRLFRIYLLNIKSAFKVDYGHKYMAASKGIKEYEPANEIEEEELFQHQGKLVGGDLSFGKDHIRKNSGMDGPGQNADQNTQRTMREETQLNSTRKLLGEEFEKSDKRKPFGGIQQEQTVIEEEKDEDLEDPKDDLINKKKGKKGRAIKDIFDLQVAIEGADDADADTKYIYIEDKEAIGDEELLNNEASQGGNSSNVTTFIILFVIIAVAAAICCYLNFTFSKTLAQYVFYMFIGSFFGDILIFRPLILLLMSLIKFCSAKRRGYSKIEYKNSSEIKDMMGKAIKDMFDSRRKLREQYKQGNSGEQSHLVPPKNNKTQNNLSANDNYSHEDMINDRDFQTQNGFDRQETKLHHNKSHEENKEDEMAHVIHENGDDNDPDSQKNPIMAMHKAFHPTDFARPKIEQDQKNFDKTQNTQVYHANIPLISNLQKAIKDKEDEKYGDLMEKKQLVNELADYNLLLLRKIYDAYEDKAERVLKDFRSDKNGVLRKRYMVPILNPNYDYEKLLKEMQDAGKGALKDQEEEDSVHLDGITVCEDFEKDLMEAIIQEASDDLVDKKIERQKIDKFGNPIDEDKAKNGIKKATPMPFYGQIEHSAEETIEEDDEEARRRRQMELLKQRLANGEELTAEELALLEQWENERIAELDKLIKQLLDKGFDNLTDQEKLKLFGFKKERLNIMLGQIMRKKSISESDQQRASEIKKEIKWLEYQELLLKQKMGILTDEELERLRQLEREFELSEIEELRRKMLDGSITEEELRRLRMLESKYEMEHMVNPFEKKEEEIHEQELVQEEEEEDDGMNHSRITDENNFAELAPVHVMNNHSRAQSPDKEKREKEEAERLEQERLEKEQRRIDEENLLKEQKLTQEQQDIENSQNVRNEQNIHSHNEIDQNTLLMQQQRESEEQELLRKQQEEDERIKREQEQEDRLRIESEEQKRLEREEEEERLRQEHESHQQKLLQETEEERNRQEILSREEEERVKRQQEIEEEQQRLQEEEIRKQQEIRDLERKETFGDLTEEEREELLRKQQEAETLRQQQEELQRQQEEEERLREEIENEKRESQLKQQRLEEDILEQQRQQELLQQQRDLEEQERQRELEREERERQIEREQEERERLMSRESKHRQTLKDHEELMRKQQEQEERQRLEGLNAASAADESDFIHSRRSGSSDEAGMSRIGSRQQDRINQQLREQQNLEDADMMMRASNQKFMDPDYQFGHDDLEFGQINAPGGANGEEESIYSHKTTTILDEEKVSFMHVDQLANADDNSEDSFDEQDMVYYNKDDLTNYSKGLGLNKVKAKQPGTNYYSEADLQQVNEGDLSDLDSQDKSRRSGRSYDPAFAGSERNGYGRGQIKHRQLEGEEHDMDIEGRVKVDAWNLNYRGKKKKLRKKKVTDAQKRKMHDLKDIYGVDAKTLAGLSKGRLPRQLLASGKLKDDDFGGNDSRLGGNSDMGFRSTQNTFAQKQTATKSRLRQSDNFGAQSDMFSFNGNGTSKRWNDINSALKGGPRDSRQDQAAASQFDQMSQQNRFPMGGQKKMTSTQENFGKIKNGMNKKRDGMNSFLEEESKGSHSGSRNGSLNKRFGAGNKLNSSKNMNKGKKGGKNSSIKKNQRRDSDIMDSHSESDQAVDDKGAQFQNRNGPWNSKSQQVFGGMNDNDRSDSEEENNQENPDFGGNQFLFKKRDHNDQSANLQAKKNKSKYLQISLCLASNAWGNSASKKKGGRGSVDNMSIEDLEAQQVSEKKGRKNTKKKGTKNSGQKGFNSNKQFDSDGFHNNDQDERDDSEGENDGGEVMFQKRNHRGDYLNGSDNEGLNRSGELGFDGAHNRSISQNKLNLSSSKPPLSGQKRQGSRRGGQGDGIDRRDYNNIYGDPYNINGVVHPGVSENVRQSNFGYGPFNMSDTEGGRLRNNLGDSDNEAYSSQSKRRNGQNQMKRGVSRNSSDPNLLNPSQVRGVKNNNRNSSRKHNRSVNERRAGEDSDGENDYIVGPESNYSALKKRPLNGSQRSSRGGHQDEDRYMLLQKERQIIEDIESDRQTDMNTSRLAKKRKIKRAAHSQNPRDAQNQRFQQMQNDRLKKKQREAEAALFAKDDDLEKGQAKLKKKKVKKDWVKKEVNYWLDYDSPYAEYLVARFKEWSPQPNQPGGRGSSAAHNQKQVSNKYKEVQNVYSKGPEVVHGRQGSQNSRSRERRNHGNDGNSMMNITQQKKNQGAPSNQFKAPQNVNSLFVDDYEEP